MLRARSWWLLAGVLLAAMLVPIWLGPYPPLYDYPNHLLEAQIVAHYHDPQLGYDAAYEIRPGWYLRSNALSTLLLIALGSILPITLAGQIVLSLYLALFVGGLTWLLRRSGAAWPLLLLAPVLAYNSGFTTGWLNFSYGTALTLLALPVYLNWQTRFRHRDLLLLALLMLLIYIAHIVAWALLLIVIAALSADQHWGRGRFGALLAALLSALPLVLLTRPLLALAATLLVPAIWLGLALLRRLRLAPLVVALGGAAITLLTAALIEWSEPWWGPNLPGVVPTWEQKMVVPLRIFTLPHQFLPVSPALIGYNLVVLLLLLLLGALLLGAVLAPGPFRQQRLRTLGVLGVVYVLIPSRTNDIISTEPRVLLFAVVVALLGLRPPNQTRWRRTSVLACALTICVLSLGATTLYAAAYARQSQVWIAALDQLAPARRVLMLRATAADAPPPGSVVRAFNAFYNGQQFSTVYTLRHGGFISRIFDNGPVRPRSEFPIPLYYWLPFDNASYVAQHCVELRTIYDAVLVWGQPQPPLQEQLDACFRAGERLGNLAFWR